MDGLARRLRRAVQSQGAAYICRGRGSVQPQPRPTHTQPRVELVRPRRIEYPARSGNLRRSRANGEGLLDEEKETKTYKQAIDSRGVGGVDLFGFGEAREELVWPRAQGR
jgi:hypothetical protein